MKRFSRIILLIALTNPLMALAMVTSIDIQSRIQSFHHKCITEAAMLGAKPQGLHVDTLFPFAHAFSTSQRSLHDFCVLLIEYRIACLGDLCASKNKNFDSFFEVLEARAQSDASANKIVKAIEALSLAVFDDVRLNKDAHASAKDLINYIEYLLDEYDNQISPECCCIIL